MADQKAVEHLSDEKLDDEQVTEDEKRAAPIGMGASIGIGAGLGLIFGVMLGNLALGLAAGAALGTVAGAILESGVGRR
jgi:uncharacterized membrane protein